MRKVIVAAVAALALVTAACTEPSESDTQVKSQKITESYQKTFEAARPYPLSQMKDSLERKQLTERLLRFNDPSKIGYVYLVSDLGVPFAFFTIQGKISSTESQLTTGDQLTRNCWQNGGCTSEVVESPSDDGSYGPNEGGVFFFTTSGVMIQLSATQKYIYTDAPLEITGANVSVTIENDATPSSTAGTGIGE